MKLAVEIADPFQIALRLADRLVILIFGQLAQLGDAFGAHAARGACRAIRFEQRTQLEHVVAILAVHSVTIAP